MLQYADTAERRTRYEQLRDALWTERAGGGFDADWKELGDWTMPRRTRFFTNDRNRGGRRNQNIINSTARFSARTLSSGLHAGLTSPARPWMKLTTPDPQLAKFKPVQEWLHLVSEMMLTVFATSNLYNVLPLVYLDMGVFATGGMAMVPDKRDLFRCYSYPLGSYALGLDERSKVSTFVRDYDLTVEQVIEQFGLQPNGRDIDWTNISTATKTLWDAGTRYAPVTVTWIVKKNELARPDRLESKYLPFTSCHFERGSEEKKFLRESGFRTFPCMTPRWDTTGEDSYGTDSPGMIALGDVKQLQIMERRKGQAIAKAVDPPLVGPSSLRMQKTSLLPGDITYQDVRDGMQGLKPIQEMRLDGLQFLTQDSDRVTYRIQRAFFEDLFLMLAREGEQGGSPITAREVDERHEEKLLALGPVLERTNDELLDPIIDRAFQMMDTAGMIPPAPPELEGVELKAEYISILAQAQKLISVTGQDRFLQTTLGLVSVYPEVRNKVDINQAVDNYRDYLGVDPRIVRSNEQADALSAAQAKAQQAAADADNAMKAAKAARDASQAPVTGDSALARVVQSATSTNQIPPQATGTGPAAVPA